MLALVRALCTLSGAMLRVYSAELLPTALRGSGMGVIAAVSFTGANIMPFILKLVSLPALVMQVRHWKKNELTLNSSFCFFDISLFLFAQRSAIKIVMIWSSA